MSDTAPTETPSRRRRAGALGVITAAGALLAATAGTSAVFTDQAVIEDNVFESGTFDIAAHNTDGVPVEVLDFAPGETREARVTVENSGSLDLRYSISGAFEAAETAMFPGPVPERNLGDILVVSVAGDNETPDTPVSLGDDRENPTPFMGDPAQGEDPGDRVLEAGADPEDLTIEVTWPEGVGEEYAGAGTILYLQFDAEQTKNN